MTTLTAASRQWASRPDDQRFTSLDELLDFSRAQRRASHATVIGTRQIEARPVADDQRSLALLGPDGQPVVPTHWAFAQLASRIKAPAAYLRSLPSGIAADAINFGLERREREDVGVLLRADDQGAPPTLAAMTGPSYGRIWNSDVIERVVDRFGDGLTGDFTVPGEFGKAVQITKDNTTLFASDRDMFIFLADETNRIEVPNRRGGQSGSLARGFFCWNSEVGNTTLGVSTFLFDYVCSNRIVWGASDVQEIKIRHTARANERFIDEVAPALIAYSKSSAAGINEAIAAAQARQIASDKDGVIDFFTKRTRFSRTQAEAINLAHIAEEGRPIETLWDATVGITALAKHKPHQDERIDWEREGGRVMSLA